MIFLGKKLFTIIYLICFFIVQPLAYSAYGVESICAKVKIEIRQEMTFERQAFDAHMQIDNGLTTLSLENINVDVLFTDEKGEPVRASSDPDDPDALFFIRVNTMIGVDDVSGNGEISPATKADIHWLIIPAPASVEGVSTNILYYVGAKLTYTLGGEEQETIVTPDSIRVKPLPLLSLDYFLPDEVYGDDPFTVETEPSIPFSLGVRIANNGYGVAKDLKIDTAQPKIIDNKLGLAVDFLIEGSEVNGVVAPDTLLIQFGDLLPQSTTVGRWLMTSSISGRFTEFTAEYSHANELGGELTSLLENVTTHTLIRDVLVNVPGRDNIRDYLGKDDSLIRVYESDSGVTEVSDVSGNSHLSVIRDLGNKVDYQLATTLTAGFSYLKLVDPQNGTKLISEVTRSDGKAISLENAWLSKKRVDDKWTYAINLFDWNTTSSYTIKMIDPSLAPKPPEFTNGEIPVEKEGEELIFLISISDSDSQGPQMQMMRVASFTAAPDKTNNSNLKIDVDKLPVGAEFTDLGDGTGLLKWTPGEGQAGDYPLTFTATDGEMTSVVRYHMVITEEDSMPESNFSGLPISGESPLEVFFVDESTSKDGIQEWLWDFGDGSQAVERNPFHTYDTGGKFTVSLTVTEIDGDTNTKTINDYIEVDDVEKTLPIETGSVEVDHNWQIVEIEDTFVDPVVVATVTGTVLDGEPASVRIKDISATNFSIRLEEGMYADGQHPLEEITYIVIERGVYKLEDGTQIIADSIVTKGGWSPDREKFEEKMSSVPVVMASVTSVNDSTPVTCAISNVGRRGFDVNLKPEKAILSAHASEQVDYLAWEISSGFAGSLLYEISRVDDVDEDWKRVQFSQAFPLAPFVVGMSQTALGSHPVTLQGRNTTAEGFDVRLAEDTSTSPNTNHRNEKVGYIALSFLVPGVDTDNDGLSDLDELSVYGTNPRLADTDNDSITDGDEVEFWGTAWSADADGDGLINILDKDSDNDGLGDGFEKQYGYDPSNSSSVPVEPVLEGGMIQVDHNWQTVSFYDKLVDPVVVATVTGAVLDQVPAGVRIKNITQTGFMIRLEEGEYADGVHPLEEVSFIAVERGIYTLESGIQIIADSLETGGPWSSERERFGEKMSSVPVLMASVTSVNDSTPVTCAISNVGRRGFDVSLKPEKAIRSVHVSEQVDYLAWEISSGFTGSLLYEISIVDDVDEDWKTVQFSQAFPLAPFVVGISQTVLGSHPVTLQGRNTTAEGFDVRLAEDISTSPNTNHRNEKVGYIALSFLVSGVDTDNDGLSDLDELSIYGTNPRLADTDGDSIIDGDEVEFWGTAWSADADGDGLINILDKDSDNDGLGDGFEKQYGYDPGNSSSVPVEPVLEGGSILVDHNWQTVSFYEKLVDPVVVATVTGTVSDQVPAGVRIKNITQTGFMIRLEEGEYADGVHPLEEVTFIAVERGIYTLESGIQIIADSLETGGGRSSDRHKFEEKMASIPVVMASVTSVNDSTPVTCVVSNIGKRGFDVRLKAEKAIWSSHASEQVDYVVWEVSSGVMGSIVYDVFKIDDIDEKWESVEFENPFLSAPLLVGMRQTELGKDPVILQGKCVTEIGFELRLAEDMSRGPNINHVDETVGFIVVGEN